MTHIVLYIVLIVSMKGDSCQGDY